MNLISLKTELRQELKLTPQLLQSMEVLQMNSQELLDYLGTLPPLLYSSGRAVMSKIGFWAVMTSRSIRFSN